MVGLDIMGLPFYCSECHPLCLRKLTSSNNRIHSYRKGRLVCSVPGTRFLIRDEVLSTALEYDRMFGLCLVYCQY